jgi:O-antigen/teichoic acid export membrane protein
MLKTGLANILLRGLTLASKFLLLMFLARLLPPSDLGIYGLVVVTISVSLYLLGLDFYTYNTREILAGDRSGYALKIRDQLVFHGATYAVVLPALLLVFVSGTLAWKYAGWFYILLVLEHLSQESYRLLITLSRSSVANLVLFLRAGIWVFAVAALGIFTPSVVSLNLVFGCWLVGVTASLVLAGFVLRNLPWRSVLYKQINWPWIRRGVKISSRFFAASICLLGVQYADRYFLQHFHGAADVGIYTLFWQIANTIQIFVYTAIATVLFPKLVESFQKGDLAAYRLHMRRLVIGVAGSILLVGMGIIIIIRPVLTIVGKEVYRDHLQVGWILIAAIAILSLSYIPHLALYVRRRDRAIVTASGSALGAALVAHLILIPSLGPVGAAWGTLIAAVFWTGLKSLFAIWYRDEHTVSTTDKNLIADVTNVALRPASKESKSGVGSNA